MKNSPGDRLVRRLQITVPVEQERIPDELQRVRAEKARIQSELDAVEKLLKMLQGFCKHPKTFVDNGWGRISTTHCEVCGKIW